MPRFFVKTNQINNDNIDIIGEDVKHIKNVLRKQIGDKIEVCNQDTGDSYKCEIENFSEDEIKTILPFFFLIIFLTIPCVKSK